MSDILVKVPVQAPTPLMHVEAAERYNKLRQIVKDGSGVDFLAKCGDIFRPSSFRSSKDGVAMRSWHKTGRAFDYDQASPAFLLTSEIKGGKQYFRTYLKCADQSGRQGVKTQIKDFFRKNTFSGYVFDFTAAAESVGFTRVPAWNGWQSRYNRREFWHYQYSPNGLTWDAAMLQLKGKARPATDTVIGKNDRGAEVLAIQKRLLALGLLPESEVDGVFGSNTAGAVAVFQKQNSLDADGLVGKDTRAKLGL
jgi:hypothetical protein